MNKRFLFIDNGVVNDWTLALNSYRGGTKVFPFTTAQDFLYIGSKLPFNHLYVKTKVANTAAAKMKVEYWSGSNEWTEVKDLVDSTDGLKQSGYIDFTPDIDKRWQRKDKSQDIPALSTVIIYYQYWMRISFDATLDSTTELSWIGNLFSNDDDLAGEYPDLLRAKVLNSIEAGKMDWEEQAVKAAQLIEQDLINRNTIDGSENILERSVYKNASISKTAFIAMASFGDDYADQRDAAGDDYKSRLVTKLARVDMNKDGIEQPIESRWKQGFMRR